MATVCGVLVRQFRVFGEDTYRFAICAILRVTGSAVSAELSSIRTNSGTAGQPITATVSEDKVRDRSSGQKRFRQGKSNGFADRFTSRMKYTWAISPSHVPKSVPNFPSDRQCENQIGTTVLKDLSRCPALSDDRHHFRWNSICRSFGCSRLYFCTAASY